MVEDMQNGVLLHLRSYRKLQIAWLNIYCIMLCCFIWKFKQVNELR